MGRCYTGNGGTESQIEDSEATQRIITEKPLRPLTGGTEEEVVLLAPGQKLTAWQDCSWRDGAAAGVAAQDRREG